MRTHVLKINSVFLLLAVTFIALVGIIKFQDLPKVQFQILTASTLIYLTWALLHHGLNKSLKLEVVIEYILTAMLAVVILYGLLI